MVNIRKIGIAFLKSAIFWVAMNSVAQSQQNKIRSDQFRAVYWGIEDGLPWTIGNVTIKDARGFLWIGNGYRGLSRFDGAFFKKYLPVNLKPDEINSDGIHSFIEDSLNNIWIGTKTGLSRYDIKADTFSNFVSAVASDKPDRSILPFWATSNHVYCIETKRQVIEYDIRSLKSKPLTTFSDDESRHFRNYESTILDTVSNCIWTLSLGSDANQQGSLLQISLKDGTPKYYTWPCKKANVIHRHQAEAIKYDKKRNSIWINSGDGLLRFSLEEKKFYQIEAMNELTKLKDYDHGVAIELDKYGRVWLATKPRGVFIYDPETKLLRPVFSNPELQAKIGESMHHIYEDRNGILWFTYWGGEGGLYEILPFHPPTKEYTANPKDQDSLSSGIIHTMVAGPGGSLWIGTEDGINIFDSNRENFEVLREKYLPGIEGKVILPLHIDTIHEKALISAGSPTQYLQLQIYEMDLKTRKCKPITFRDGSKKIDDFVIVPDFVKPYKNGLLVPDEKHGIFEIKSGSLFADLLIPLSQEIGRLYAVEDRFIFIQAGGGKPNVTFKNKNGKWIRASHPFDSLNWTYIVYNEKDKSHWVGLPYQLIHFDKDFRKIRSYKEEDGFNGAIFSMVSDNSGNLWFINVVKQISRLNTSSGVINQLSEADGYKPRVFDWFDPGVMDSRGNIYFGTKTQGPVIGGLIAIHPENYSSAVTSSVYFRSLLVNQKPATLSSGLNALTALSLRYNQNTIGIETGVIDFYSKGKSRIRYKLERNGRDEGWQYAPANYNIQYEGLPSGTYRLVLQASNVANEFNSPEKVLMITISAPFWQTWWFRIAAGLAIIALIYAIVQYRSRNLKRRNVALEQNVTIRTNELKVSLEELKETQQQLIQQEKMASLGELTAGIAHEIQNPLNFVNNFSEINTELIVELKEEIEKGNISDIKEIAQDIGENEKKIMHHGKRADAIIKGMLQHSRASSGQKEPTDINALADEYLRLSYHGLRAKDKSFNAELITNFDERLSASEFDSNKINIIPQDIGRVVLNLFTNAFYAVHEKKKMLGEPFDPAVFVSTKKLNDKVELRVRDNGNGIPEKIMNKIFQPFFTTKPAGEGTGLGLSLSYDIITKAHGGELKVETKAGEYAEFIILLPVK